MLDRPSCRCCVSSHRALQPFVPQLSLCIAFQNYIDITVLSAATAGICSLSNGPTSVPKRQQNLVCGVQGSSQESDVAALMFSPPPPPSINLHHPLRLKSHDNLIPGTVKCGHLLKWCACVFGHVDNRTPTTHRPAPNFKPTLRNTLPRCDCSRFLRQSTTWMHTPTRGHR